MRIAENRIPLFEVILPTLPSPAEEFARSELRRFLLAMLGRSPVLEWAHGKGAQAVKILINCRDQEQAAGLDVLTLAPSPESFYLAPVGNRYFIIGGGVRGTLYGVYDLLDRLGCRWFTPDVSHIPRCENLDLPDVPLAGKPAFEYRDILNRDITDPIWLLRNRLNGHHVPVMDFLGGHDVCGFVAHSCFALVPPSQYFASHPEYFSEIDGVRRHVAGQLCLTNPEVVRIAADSLVAYMRARPDAKLFSVSQMDWSGWCTCAQCQQAAEELGAQSGLYIRFVNALAERTISEFPDRIITTLAYHYTEAPPSVPMTLHPNVRVQLCPIATCQIHPFETCGSPQDEHFLSRIRGWSAMTDQLYIWHYATDFSHFSLLLPNLVQLTENIKFYKKKGVRGMFMQANGGSEQSDLKGYLMARLLWNPDVLLETVLAEFLPAVYGVAAGDIRDYIDLIQQEAAQRTELHLGCYEPPDHPFYTDALLAGAYERLSRAERKVRGTARERAGLLRGGVELAQLFKKYIKREFRREGKVFHNDASAGDVRRFKAVIKERRMAGNIPLAESTPLDFSVDRMSRWLERHNLIELRSGVQQVFVAPSLGGRILEWHVDGRQLLEKPDAGNRHFQYPLSEGCSEMAIELPYSFRGSTERYQVASRTKNTVRLVADLSDGFRMERLIRLGKTGLSICGTLTNASSQHKNRQWGAGLHLNLGDWEQITIGTLAGEREVVRAAGPSGATPSLVLARETRPTGSWRMTFGAYVMEAAFSAEDVSCLILERDDERNKVAIDLRSETRSFAPGQSISVEQNYRIGKI